ncbi:uncharacterized protein LOC126549238 [Aphis gossypii]|uniref:uncharacterized protein LOC126549238 n=1 Tax=Aphis gossypii TaxID=80765 RepID=UPI0021597F96|nr:uncharacterized protein LOC126549238 [Aphis gossypii]
MAVGSGLVNTGVICYINSTLQMSREGEEHLAGRDSRWRPSRGHMRSSLEDLVWQTTSQLDILRQTRATLIGLGAEFPPDAPQGLSVQQIGDVDTAELPADPRLWVAYERGWREHAKAAPASAPAPTDRRPIPGPVRHTQRTVRKATTAKPQPRPARAAQGTALASDEKLIQTTCLFMCTQIN